MGYNSGKNDTEEDIHLHEHQLNFGILLECKCSFSHKNATLPTNFYIVRDPVATKTKPATQNSKFKEETSKQHADPVVS